LSWSDHQNIDILSLWDDDTPLGVTYDACYVTLCGQDRMTYTGVIDLVGPEEITGTDERDEATGRRGAPPSVDNDSSNTDPARFVVDWASPG
jgi:hypothetical protein